MPERPGSIPPIDEELRDLARQNALILQPAEEGVLRLVRRGEQGDFGGDELGEQLALVFPTLLEIALTIKRLTKSHSKIVFKKLPIDDPKVRRPDITIARKKLKWEPKVPLEEGLKRTIEYFRRIL